MINIEYLKNMSNLKRFEKGSAIIREGENDLNGMYILLQGNAGVYKNHGKTEAVKLFEIGPGGFFGEMSLFLNQERTATVIAEETVTALQIARHYAYEFFESQPQATYTLIQALCQRLETFNKKASAPAPDIPAKPVEKPAPAPEMPAKPVEKPAAAEAKAKVSSFPSDLFPEGHKDYSKKLPNPDENTLLSNNYQCPLCSTNFKKMNVRVNVMKSMNLDSDLRARYKGADATFFETVTCPSCHLSAFASHFEKARVNKEQELISLLKPYKKLSLTSDAPKEYNEVFAGMYLALVCAPVCFKDHQMHSARLWHRIIWMYNDCEDLEMEIFAMEQALRYYLQVYLQTDVPQAQATRIELYIGELSFKLRELDQAQQYFLKVRTSRIAEGMFKRHAEDRINEIRSLKKMLG